MKIITISREFGSGGRELGKRLADITGYDYYDREIISAIAESEMLDEDYVEEMLENPNWSGMTYNYGHSFYIQDVLQSPQVNLLQAQRKVMENIARAGRDCIIVGRNADIFLAEYEPFKIFVCAEMEARIKRCMERAEDGEGLSEKEIEQNIKRIDKNRAKTREIFSSGKWGDSNSYNLTVNTTGWDLKYLAPAVAAFAKSWFDTKE